MIGDMTATLIAKIFLGWMFLALVIAMFVGGFIKVGRGPDAQNEDN